MTDQHLASSTEKTASGRDRRTWIRYPSSPETPFFSLAEQEEIIFRRAKVRDISKGGIGLVLNSEVKPGTLVDIVLPEIPEAASRSIQARITYSAPLSSRQWVIGCAFMQQLSDEELKVLLQAAAAAAANDAGE